MRIVQYYTTHRNVGKLPTVQHFMSEGVPRSTIYNIIKNFEQGKSVKRKSGSGRKTKITTTSRVKWLKRRMLSINQPSSRVLSQILCCSHQHVTKTIRSKVNLVRKKKVKGPRYSEDQTAIKRHAENFTHSHKERILSMMMRNISQCRVVICQEMHTITLTGQQAASKYKLKGNLNLR